MGSGYVGMALSNFSKRDLCRVCQRLRTFPRRGRGARRQQQRHSIMDEQALFAYFAYLEHVAASLEAERYPV